MKDEVSLVNWHMLMNHKLAIKKLYFMTGIKDLAKSSGYPVT